MRTHLGVARSRRTSRRWKCGMPLPGRAPGPDGPLAIIVVVALLLEIAEEGFGVFIGPIRQHDHVVAIVLNRILVAWIDNQRRVVSRLLLKAAVAVVPVGAALLDRDGVSKRLAGRDPWKTETGNAVHIGRRSDAVPMNRGRHLQAIGDRYRYRVAFAPSEQRPRNRTVYN